MGAALGTIMATIITAHMTNMSEKSTLLQGRTLPIVIPMDISISAVPWDMYTIYPQAMAATATVPDVTMNRSFFKIDSM